MSQEIVETDALQGPACLSPKTLEHLSITGAFLSAFPLDVPLPKAYLIMRAVLEEEDLRVCLGDPYSYRGLLPHVERMARQGLTMDQIADRLAIPQHRMREAQTFLPDLHAAIKGGLASGIELAASQLDAKISNKNAPGDTQAITFKLKTKGGFAQPTEKAPVVTVNVGTTANVDLDAIQDMRRRQSELIEDVDYSELS